MYVGACEKEGLEGARHTLENPNETPMYAYAAVQIIDAESVLAGANILALCATRCRTFVG
ncbi:hypothetical protein CA234_18065 [Sphingomonas sp. ABOLE]|uniref:hypothetical protein n=1 Tax=Sphingomonas sp. ABOLE TaxID=1985878 RepID=UPI000F7F9A52|nr:hypothetical protein [Sphingomonas sp. ABOLE]RSV36688.1 hypothetical protein CA234_18065 [Sphingomonas sp. ABOLE]